MDTLPPPSPWKQTLTSYLSSVKFPSHWNASAIYARKFKVAAPGMHARALHHAALRVFDGRPHRPLGSLWARRESWGQQPNRVPGAADSRARSGHVGGSAVGDVLPQAKGQVGPVHERKGSGLWLGLRVHLGRRRTVVRGGGDRSIEVRQGRVISVCLPLDNILQSALARIFKREDGESSVMVVLLSTFGTATFCRSGCIQGLLTTCCVSELASLRHVCKRTALDDYSYTGYPATALFLSVVGLGEWWRQWSCFRVQPRSSRV